MPKKPRVQVEVRDISAIEPEAVVEKPHRAARVKPQPEPVEVRTLWDFAAEQEQEPISAVSKKESEPETIPAFQQLVLW